MARRDANLDLLIGVACFKVLSRNDGQIEKLRVHFHARETFQAAKFFAA
jgi:hypothetical protein